MAYDTKTVKRDGSGITPVPQHFNPIADDYEPIYGRNNAGRVELYGPDGNPISADDSNKLAVRATEIESLLNDIKGKDFATQTTVAAILNKIISAPATEAKQTAIELILNSLDGKDYSTLAKQNEILVKLAALETKLSSDPATQTTLAAILAKIIAAPATEAKQDALAALIGEVDADPTANSLLARLKSLETKIDAIIDGTSPAVTQLSGSYVEIGGVSFAVSGGDTLRGKSADKPDAVAAHAVIPYCFYFSIDTGTVEATDGTNWVVI